MLRQLSLGLALMAAALAKSQPSSTISDPTITQGPQIELIQRQNDARYIGWFSWNGIWSSGQCRSDATMFRSGAQWSCCPTRGNGCDVADMPIGCVSGSLIFNITKLSKPNTIPCTWFYPDTADRSFSICNTLFMFENERDSSPLTNIDCGPSSLNWSYYRQVPATAVTSETSSSPSTQPSSAVLTSTASATSTPTLATVASQEKKESKAWIAGAVIGPVIGLALIGLGALLFIRSKKNKRAHGAALEPNTADIPEWVPPKGSDAHPFCPRPMQQNAGSPGMKLFGVAKHDSWVPQSPCSTISSNPHLSTHSMNNMHLNHTPPMGGAPIFEAPAESISPAPGNGQPVQQSAESSMHQHAEEVARPLSGELEDTQVTPKPTHPQPLQPPASQS